MVVWQSAFKTEKPSRGAWLPPFTLPDLAAGPRRSCRSECQVQSTLSANQRTCTTETCFSLATAALCDSPQCQVQIHREAAEVCQSPLQDSKATKAAASFPSSPYPHPSQLHYWQHLGTGHSTGISPTTSFMGLVP